MTKKRVTILSTADFNNPIWTNKQFIASGLSEIYDVTYIDSIGLRQPSFSITDIRRILGRAFSLRGSRRHSTEALRGSSDKISVVSPKVLPFHRFRWIRSINKLLLTKQVLKVVPRDQRHILWTFSPLTYGLEECFTRTVYHSVDLLHTFPGIPSKAVLNAEKALVQTADEIIVSSRGLKQHIEAAGRFNVHLWENVADTELYEKSSRRNPEQRAIFSGNLTPTKVNFGLLLDIAEQGVELVLAGPMAIDGTSATRELELLLSRPNVTYLGRLGPEDLASEVGNCTVGLIPYNVNSHTEGIFPMKVYEYLSAGLEVVATPITSLKAAQLPAGVSVVASGDFVPTVLRAMNAYTPTEAEKRRESARPHSWTNRFLAAKQLIERLDVPFEPQ